MKNVRQVTIYGKGGIGKSTTSSNLSVAFAEKGMKVMQVGCDPKRDSTKNLTGRLIPTVLDLLRIKGIDEVTSRPDLVSIDEIVYDGFKGVKCIEAGGPEPGIGCGGRGVITALDLIQTLGIYDALDLDVVVYDVLGDLVCGGFSMPIRRGYAREVFIVTSGEFMALYAANNICRAIKRYADRGVPTGLGGLICNSRLVPNEEEIVKQVSSLLGTKMIGFIPRSNDILRCDLENKTVFEGYPKEQITENYRELANKVLAQTTTDIPTPVEFEELIKTCRELGALF